MEKRYVFHPASAATKVLDGSSLQQIDNGATTLFSFWQQEYDIASVLRCFFQNMIIPADLDLSSNVEVRVIFRQLDAGAGNVRIEMNGKYFDPLLNPTTRETGPLVDVIDATTAAVPGAVDGEFELVFIVAAPLFAAHSGEEFLFEVVHNGGHAGNTFAGRIGLVRTDVSFTVQEPGYWQTGLGPGEIHYALGNVGINNNNPAEKLSVGGAILLGNTIGTTNGTIRWTGVDLEGRVGGAWISLTSAASGNTLDQAYDQGGAGAGRTISVAAALPVYLNGAGTQALRLADDLKLELGTEPAAAKGFMQYSSGSTTLQLNTVGASSLALQTGDVGGGTTSGVSLGTGDGNISGPASIYTGSGAAGATGLISLTTGNSTGAASGAIQITTGTGATSGDIDLITSVSATRGAINVQSISLNVQTHYGIWLGERTVVPANPTNAGYIYVADSGGDSELNYLDDSGNSVPLTEDGWPTAGIGTYSTTFDVNLGATVALSTSDLTLRGGTGVVRYDARLELDPANSWTTFRHYNVTGGAEVATTLNLGSSGLTLNLQQTIGFGSGDGAVTAYPGTISYQYIGARARGEFTVDKPVVLTGSYLDIGIIGTLFPATPTIRCHAGFGGAFTYPGTIVYNYEAGVTNGVFDVSKSIRLPDNVPFFCGADRDGSVEYATAGDSLSILTIDQAATDSSNILARTGDVSTAGTSSGDVDIETGDSSDNNASTGDISLTTGSLPGGGTGTRGGVYLSGRFLLSSTETVAISASGGVFSLQSGLTTNRLPVVFGSADTSAAPNRIVLNRGGSGVRDAGELVMQSTTGTYYALWVDSAGKLRIEAIGSPLVTYHSADAPINTTVGQQTGP